MTTDQAVVNQLKLLNRIRSATVIVSILGSFIIQYDKEPELRRILDDSTHQITGSRINHDIKNDRNIHKGQASGNIKGYEKPVTIVFYTPKRIKPTKQYLTRMEKLSCNPPIFNISQN